MSARRQRWKTAVARRLAIAAAVNGTVPPLELLEDSRLFGDEGRAWLDREQAVQAENAVKAATISANLTKTRAMLDRLELEGARWAPDGRRLTYEVRRTHEDWRNSVFGILSEAEARMAFNARIRESGLAQSETIEILSSDGKVIERREGPAARR